MKKRTRSILEEINTISRSRDRKYLIENNASNIIASAINLIEMISESYDDETANDLTKRLVNSIRSQDIKKFERGIKKANASIRDR
jgi:hypothetical protein